MLLQYIALITVQYYLFQTTAIDTSHNCKFSQNLNESQRWTRDGDNLTHYLRHFISCYKVYNCTSNLLLIIGKAPLVTATLQQNNNNSYILTLIWKINWNNCFALTWMCMRRMDLKRNVRDPLRKLGNITVNNLILINTWNSPNVLLNWRLEQVSVRRSLWSVLEWVSRLICCCNVLAI